jgi:hypothetical protein
MSQDMHTSMRTTLFPHEDDFLITAKLEAATVRGGEVSSRFSASSLRCCPCKHDLLILSSQGSAVPTARHEPVSARMDKARQALLMEEPKAKYPHSAHLPLLFSGPPREPGMTFHRSHP